MTMPGRSCVALTLLMICAIPALRDQRLPERFAISEIPEGENCAHTARGMTRGTPGKVAPNANQQYKGPRSWRSIVPLWLLGSLGGGLGHDFFDFVGVAGEAFAEEFVAGFGNQDVVFDADAEVFFGDVDAGLDGDDHAGLERFAVFAGVVDVEADVVAEAVNEILAERFAVKIFAVGIDVVVRNFVNAFRAFLAVVHAGFDRCQSRVLRA